MSTMAYFLLCHHPWPAAICLLWPPRALAQITTDILAATSKVCFSAFPLCPLGFILHCSLLIQSFFIFCFPNSVCSWFPSNFPSFLFRVHLSPYLFRYIKSTLLLLVPWMFFVTLIFNLLWITYLLRSWWKAWTLPPLETISGKPSKYLPGEESLFYINFLGVSFPPSMTSVLTPLIKPIILAHILSWIPILYFFWL